MEQRLQLLLLHVVARVTHPWRSIGTVSSAMARLLMSEWSAGGAQTTQGAGAASGHSRQCQALKMCNAASTGTRQQDACDTKFRFSDYPTKSARAHGALRPRGAAPRHVAQHERPRPHKTELVLTAHSQYPIRCMRMRLRACRFRRLCGQRVARRRILYQRRIYTLYQRRFYTLKHGRARPVQQARAIQRRCI
eukprot:363665-Chlamydomonas_euryale.AAC.6